MCASLALRQGGQNGQSLTPCTVEPGLCVCICRVIAYLSVVFREMAEIVRGRVGARAARCLAGHRGSPLWTVHGPWEGRRMPYINHQQDFATVSP